MAKSALGYDPRRHEVKAEDINYATRWLKTHAADSNADAATVGGLGGR